MSDRMPGARTTISRIAARDATHQEWLPAEETPSVGNSPAWARLSASIERAAQRASDGGSASSLLVFEVDHFREIRAEVGPAIGELILDEVEACLAREIRDTDVAGRVGGDAFALLLSDSNRRSAVAVAERIRDTVARSFGRLERKTPQPVTVSVGVAAMPVDARDATDVFTMAYYGMDHARRSGGNRVQLAADAMPISERSEG